MASIEACDHNDPDLQPVLPTALTYAKLHEAAERVACVLAVMLESSLAPVDEPSITGQTLANLHSPSSVQASLSQRVIATWMWRSNAWDCVYCAAARLQVPSIAMSRDLPDAAVQRRRNQEILATHRPRLTIVDDNAAFCSYMKHQGSSADASWMPTSVQFRDVWQDAWTGNIRTLAPTTPASPDEILCYCYTGGTTKASRCAIVTHRMALHEVEAYPLVVKLSHEDRVLQQHSMYWAASAVGEIDIALAFGCALVFCETWGTDDLAAAIRDNGVTCSGIIPSILASIEPDDVPSLKCAFTWGEALQPRVARKWAQRVHLIDLLISTECWLSFYADWSASNKGSWVAAGTEARPTFRSVPRTNLRLKPLASVFDCDVACASRSGADVGELLVSGPMVSPGYIETAFNSISFEIDSAGARWYRTKDCIRRCCDGGFVFSGRADDLVKVGGVWVDSHEVEAKLLDNKDVNNAFVCNHHAFVVVGQIHDGLMASLRAVLPPDFALFLVPSLPRKAGSDKVDRQRLCELVGTGIVTTREEKEARLCARELKSMISWYRPMLIVLSFAAIFHCMFLLPNFVDGRWRDHGPLGKLYFVYWCFLFGIRVLVDLIWRLLCMTYMVLIVWHHPRLARYCRNLPAGVYTLFPFLCAVVPGPLSGLMLASPGVYLAVRRSRLLSWPLVCALGFPVWAREAGYWLQDRGNFDWINWYLWHMSRPVVNVGRRVTSNGRALGRATSWRMKRLLGYTRKCDCCKTHNLLSAGHIDETVDKHWYCNKCWSIYNKYRQCTKCQDWATHGQDEGDGWMCQKCISAMSSGNAQRSEAPKPEGVAPIPEWLRRRQAMESRVIAIPGSCLAGQGGKRPDGSAPPSATQAASVVNKSKEWKIIELATGMRFDSLSDSLSCIDSLRKTKMTSALRREAGKRLSRETLKGVTVLEDLLARIAQLPDDPYQAPSTCPHAEREYPMWGMMWGSKCQWVLRRSRPLSEAVLRSALAELVTRHVAVGAELRDPYRLFTGVQQAFTALEVWRKRAALDFLTSGGVVSVEADTMLGPFSKLVSRAANYVSGVFDQVISWSFKNAWPRACAREVTGVPTGLNGSATCVLPLKVLPCVATLEEAEKKIWYKATEFTPPFHVVFVPYGEHQEEGALLHIAVTHMLSDGYSIVPLLNDLARLVACAEETIHNSNSVVHESLSARAKLPAIPHMFAALQPRLMHTIEGGGSDLSNGLKSTGITPEPLGKRYGTDSFTVFVTFPVEAVGAIRQAALHLGIPQDIAMLTIIGVSLAWFEGQRTEPIAMIVPQRDGPAENDMVGLFADIRHLSICTDGLSFAGVALRLHHIVTHRIWKAPGLATQFDLTLVNFEWTDFEELHGFVQHINLDQRTETAWHPLKIAVEQPDRETWRMRVAFQRYRYGEEDRKQFFDFFDRSLRTFLTSPLDFVWSEDNSECTETASCEQQARFRGAGQANSNTASG